MLPTAQSPAQIQPCALSSHNQPQVVSEGSVFTRCSFCPEPPAPSCRLTPTLLPSSLLWELGLGIRMGSQLPQSRVPPPPPIITSACLLLWVSHRMLSSSRPAPAHSWPHQVPSTGLTGNQQPGGTCQTGCHGNQSEISDFSCSLPAPLPSPTPFSAGPPYQATRDMA